MEKDSFMRVLLLFASIFVILLIVMINAEIDPMYFANPYNYTNTSLTSAEIDGVCNASNSLLYRTNGTWGCGQLDSGDFNITHTNVTLIQLNESDPIWTSEKANYYTTNETFTRTEIEELTSGTNVYLLFHNVSSGISTYEIMNDTDTRPKATYTIPITTDNQYLGGFISENASVLGFNVIREVVTGSFHAKVNTISGVKLISGFYEVYVRHSNGTETYVQTSELVNIYSTFETHYDAHILLDNDIELADSDRFLVKLYTNFTGGGGGNPTLSLYIEGNTLAGVEFSTIGLHFATQTDLADYLTKDGTTPLTGNWNAGSYSITASSFIGSGSSLSGVVHTESDPIFTGVNSTLARIGDCTVGQIVQNITTAGVECVDLPSETSPAGSTGEVQYNNGGVFGADSNFKWNNTDKSLTLGVKSTSGGKFTVNGDDNIYGDVFQLEFDPSTGSLQAGINAIATPRTNLGSAIALGVNLDTTYTPLYTAEAKGDTTFTVHGRARGDRSIAIGSRSFANNSGIAIGYNTKALKTSSIAMGSEAWSYDVGDVVVGFYGIANKEYYSGGGSNAGATAIGSITRAYGLGSLAIGSGAKTEADYTGTFSIVSDAFNNGIVTNNITESILFGFNIIQTESQHNLMHIENNKGVRIGATTGETINMTGGDLYVQNNTEIGGYLVVGDNTETGLSTGDGNFSDIYLDTLNYKSPIFLCSIEWCKVIIPEEQEEMYIKFDTEWTPLIIKYANVEYSETNFEKDIAKDKIKIAYDKVKAKYNAKKNKKAEEEIKKACLSAYKYNIYENGICKIDKKKECEVNDYTIWTGTNCYENPILKCYNNFTNKWNYDTDTCEIDLEKDCDSKNGNYNLLTNECVIILKEPVNTNTPENCMKNKNMIWNNKECIPLTEYYINLIK